MSYLIIVGFNRVDNQPITESELVLKIITAICREEIASLCQWLKKDFGFFNENRYKEQIEEMYGLLSEHVSTLALDQDKTAWLKEYWIVDCLYSALNKCFPQLNFNEITKLQERWLDTIYSGQKPKLPLHPALGSKGQTNISCESCFKNTIPFKVRVTIPEFPLPTTPNYCPECYPQTRMFHYNDMDGNPAKYEQIIKIHKL